jgi:hypothetical protein
MITAASELSRNTLVHGGGGEMRWELVDEGVKRGLRLHFEDQGPGIPTSSWRSPTAGPPAAAWAWACRAASGWCTNSSAVRRPARAPA